MNGGNFGGKYVSKLGIYLFNNDMGMYIYIRIKIKRRNQLTFFYVWEKNFMLLLNSLGCNMIGKCKCS